MIKVTTRGQLFKVKAVGNVMIKGRYVRIGHLSKFILKTLRGQRFTRVTANCC